MQTVYLIVGVPASGKSTILSQCDSFERLEHDAFIGHPPGSYVKAIKRLVAYATKSVLVETPFSISQISEPLAKAGIIVKPLVIVESSETLHKRWDERSTAAKVRAGHLSRQCTFEERARSHAWPMGTASQMLAYLQSI